MTVPQNYISLVLLDKRDLFMSKSAAKSWLLLLQTPRCIQFRFSAAILDFQWNGTVYEIADTTIKKFDPENMGVAARILFLSALELEIPLGGNSTPQLHSK
jgi:hypothetical protein